MRFRSYVFSSSSPFYYLASLSLSLSLILSFFSQCTRLTGIYSSAVHPSLWSARAHWCPCSFASSTNSTMHCSKTTSRYFSPYSVHHTMCSILCNPYYILHTLYSILCTPHYVLLPCSNDICPHTLWPDLHLCNEISENRSDWVKKVKLLMIRSKTICILLNKDNESLWALLSISKTRLIW